MGLYKEWLYSHVRPEACGRDQEEANALMGTPTFIREEVRSPVLAVGPAG